MKLFPSTQQVPSKRPLDVTISVHLDPETRAVETVLISDPFGMSEYDPEASRWVPLGQEDTWRVRDYSNSYPTYQVDWSNAKAFDKNDKLILLDLYSKGGLTEEYLKSHTKFVSESLPQEK